MASSAPGEPGQESIVVNVELRGLAARYIADASAFPTSSSIRQIDGIGTHRSLARTSSPRLLEKPTSSPCLMCMPVSASAWLPSAFVSRHRCPGFRKSGTDPSARVGQPSSLANPRHGNRHAAGLAKSPGNGAPGSHRDQSPRLSAFGQPEGTDPKELALVPLVESATGVLKAFEIAQIPCVRCPTSGPVGVRPSWRCRRCTERCGRHCLQRCPVLGQGRAFVCSPRRSFRRGVARPV
jgi:hypothetical protein